MPTPEVLGAFAAEAVAAEWHADERNPTPAEWSERRPLDLAVERDPEPPDYLVDGRIERGTITALTGDTGTAKSFHALDLAVRTVTGADEWLGSALHARHGSVVYIDEENPVRLVRARVRALGLTVEVQHHLRYYSRLGVQLGAEGADWTEWLHYELERAPADLVVIDTGAAATAPEVNDNDQVVALYAQHLRPIAATGVPVVLLLHERKPHPGTRTNRSMATMGARSWIAQADAQLVLSVRGRGVETPTEGEGFAYEKRFQLEVGKLRDGAAEQTEVTCIRSQLDARRVLLSAEVVNEGEASADDAKVEALQQEVTELLVEAGEPQRKVELAEALGVERGDRTFTRALEVGIEGGAFERVKRGVYQLTEAADA